MGGSTAVLLYGSRNSVDSSVLRAFPASNARFARDEPSSKRVGGVALQLRAAKATFVALHSAESRQNYFCGGALSRESPKLQGMFV